MEVVATPVAAKDEEAPKRLSAQERRGIKPKKRLKAHFAWQHLFQDSPLPAGLFDRKRRSRI